MNCFLVDTINLHSLHSRLVWSSICIFRLEAFVNTLSHFSQEYPSWTLRRWMLKAFSKGDLKSHKSQGWYLISFFNQCLLIIFTLSASNSHVRHLILLLWYASLCLFRSFNVLLLTLHKSHLWTYMHSSKIPCTFCWWYYSKNKLSYSFPQVVQLALSCLSSMCFTTLTPL